MVTFKPPPDRSKAMTGITDIPQPGEREEILRALALTVATLRRDERVVEAVMVEAAMREMGTLTRELAEARAEVAKERDDNRILRELLASAYSGAAHLYTDDGELVDSRKPLIDYRRNSAGEIRWVMQERAHDALAPAQEGE